MINNFKKIKINDEKVNFMSKGQNQPIKKQLSVGTIHIEKEDDGVNTVIDTFRLQNINSNASLRNLRRLQPNLAKATLEINPIVLENIQNGDEQNQISNETLKTVSSNLYNLAQKFMHMFKFILLDERLHVWNHDEGIYTSMEQNHAEKFIRKHSPINIKKQLTSAKIKEIIKWIEAECSVFDRSHSQQKNQHYIAFNNGLFNLLTEQLDDFNSDIIFTQKLSVNYNEYPTTSNAFEQFIHEITNGDPDFYDQLQELFGYVISEVRNVKILPILLGPKDSGKSICLKILEALVGEKNCSSVSLAQLHRTEFLSELNKKKLNTCGEISSSVNFSVELLKQLTGGDTLMARGLYNNPFKFNNTAAMVFAGNSLPGFSNKDSHNALLKRISLFYFTKSIPPEEQDIYLLDKILNNLEYVATWALNGFINWKNNNFTFTTPKKAEYFIQQTSLTTNSVESFVKQICLLSNDYAMFKQDFIKCYHNFCEEHNIDPQSEKQIDKILAENYLIKRKKSRLDSSNPKSAYFGIKLNNDFLMEEL